ncbi:hypothetical protein diail_406 [Diaporthe ilicicola]|nr:hypothetical protein diail_406 [Diaporthe ilicicola]
MSATDHVLHQSRQLPLKITKEHCEGRTFIVTGANVGLGKEACRHLVAIGASKVIMAVRNVEAGEAAKKDIEADTSVTGVAEVWQLDLSDYDSVKSFAAKAEKLVRIESIIENAAVAGQERVGNEYLTIKVNVTSTFLLAALLLPKLRSDAAKFSYTPRLSIVTSGTGFDMRELWKECAHDPIIMMNAKTDMGPRAYPASKAIVTLATRELANRLPLSHGRVIINTVSPGLCETSLSRNSPPEFKEHLKQLWAACGRTAEVGSRTILAGSVAGEESHGSYMNDCAPENELVPDWMHAAAQTQAWNSVAKELEKIQPGCVAKALE